jgi:tetratricopeptide (TPR) repeat protein
MSITPCLDDDCVPAVATVTAGGDIRTLLSRGEQALYTDGDLQASRDWFDAAYRLAEIESDPAALAAAAIGMGGLWVHEHRSMAAAAVVEERTHRALSTVDPAGRLALRLRIRLDGEADYRRGEHGAILARVAEARRLGDPLALAEAISVAHHCALGPDHSDLRHRLAHELIAEGFRTPRRSDLLMGLLWRTIDRLLDGDPHAERGLAELRGVLAAQRHLAVGYVIDAIEVMLSIRAGLFKQAETGAATCAERGTAAGDADAAGWYGAQMVAIRWYQGRIAELVPLLRELVNSPTLSATDNSYLAALAVAAATAGESRAAAGALARLGDLARLPRSSSWLVSVYGAVEAAHLLGDDGTAASGYELLVPFADRPMVVSLGVACFGSVQHALGVAALTLGNPERAVEHFRAAVRDNRTIEHWPATVLSRARLAQALAQRDGARAGSEAQRELELCRRDAAGLGMLLPEPSPAPRGRAGGAPRAVGPQLATCLRRGQQWEVSLGARSVLVGHSRGMQYLAVLTANPGHEIRAAELAAGPGSLEATVVDASVGAAQPILDDVAKREYQRRLAKLQAAIEEYEADGELGRAEELRYEREWLVAELTAATGLGGRSRGFATNDERARVAVGKAIRRALERIAALDAVLGNELRDAVHTGVRCCYRPF